MPTANQQNLYGFPGPITSGAPKPVIANRAPTVNDHYPLGTPWIWPVTSTNATATTWIAASANAGATTWNLNEAGGGGGVFSTLTSTGQTTLATLTAGTANSFGNANGATSVALISGSGGISLAGNTGTVGITGNLFGVAAVTAINTTLANSTSIASGTNTGTLTLGNTTGNTTIHGDVTLDSTSATLILSSATSFIGFGGIEILAGAGDPSGALTAPKGSLFLNTTGSSVNTRAFINTNGATTWTAITTAG